MPKRKKYCCTTAEGKEDCHCACGKAEKEYLDEIAKLDELVEAVKELRDDKKAEPHMRLWAQELINGLKGR